MSIIYSKSSKQYAHRQGAKKKSTFVSKCDICDCQLSLDLALPKSGGF